MDASQPSTSGRRNGVSAVSLIGGRCVHTCHCNQIPPKLAMLNPAAIYFSQDIVRKLKQQLIFTPAGYLATPPSSNA